MAWLDYADKVASIIGALAGLAALIVSIQQISSETKARELRRRAQFAANGRLVDVDAWEHLILLDRRKRRRASASLLYLPVASAATIFGVGSLAGSLLDAPGVPVWVCAWIGYSAFLGALALDRKAGHAGGVIAKIIGPALALGSLIMPIGLATSAGWIMYRIFDTILPLWMFAIIAVVGLLVYFFALLMIGVRGLVELAAGGSATDLLALAGDPTKNHTLEIDTNFAILRPEESRKPEVRQKKKWPHQLQGWIKSIVRKQ